MLNGLGIETGVDMDKLVAAGDFISRFLDRPTNSRVAKALMARAAA
jgi:hydroxymethylglutaryl-CoA lyase